MKRKFIVTPTGNGEQYRHLLPRFRHKDREQGLGSIADRSPIRAKAA